MEYIDYSEAEDYSEPPVIRPPKHSRFFLSTRYALRHIYSPMQGILIPEEVGIVSADGRELWMNTEDFNEDFTSIRKKVNKFVYQNDFNQSISFWSVDPEIDWTVFYHLLYQSGAPLFPNHCDSIHDLRESRTITEPEMDREMMEYADLPQSSAIEKARATRDVFYYYFRLIPMDKTELDSIPL